MQNEPQSYSLKQKIQNLLLLGILASYYAILLIAVEKKEAFVTLAKI